MTMIYVASSWRNPIYPAVVDTLRRAGHELYDFRNPPGGEGFHWSQVGGTPGSRSESIERYQEMLAHPRAEEGFANDMNHLATADTVVLLLPCGKSAHLELGFAVGAGKRTAILLENPVEPDLMYKMVDFLAPSLSHLLTWLERTQDEVTAQPMDRITVYDGRGERRTYMPVDRGPQVIGGRYTPGVPGRRHPDVGDYTPPKIRRHSGGFLDGGGQNSGA